MPWYLLFVVLRLLVTIFFLLTSTYSLLNYTPFVFYQFIRPRVFGWVNQFVAWHHVWYCAVYLISVITLLPDLRRAKAGDPDAVFVGRVALAYVVVFGLVAEWLVVTPYLPKLWNDTSSLVTAMLSFLPLLWLAVVDHLAVRPDRHLADHRVTARSTGGSTATRPASGTDQRRLLIACVSTAAYLWLVHLGRTLVREGVETNAASWTMTSAWSLAMNVTAMMVVYAVLNGVTAVASLTRAPRFWEYVQVVGLAAAATSAILSDVVFPNLAFGEHAPLMVSVVAGATLALTWSAIALRRPRAYAGSFSGLDVFLAPLAPPAFNATAQGVRARAAAQSAAVIAVPLIAFIALGRVERSDWNFLLQKLIVMLEWMLTFGFLLGACRAIVPAKPAAASAPATLLPPVLAVAALLGVAQGARYVPNVTGGNRMEADLSLDRYAGRDLSFKLLYDALVDHPGRDAQFYRYLQANTGVSHTASITPPDARFSPGLEHSNGPLPNVFLFVLDSLRRDYLSPFNRAVTFTPQIERFASESFAFDNAFSHYGGTALAVPSIWAGGMVIHRTSMPDFPRSNALERLLDADGYQWFMSLDTVMAPLLAPHPDLVELDRGRRVMEFDICHTLDELEGDLGRRHDPNRPVFAFSLPQNLHISLRQHGPVPPGEHYPGFFEPYAAEVHRIDACFGAFVAYLKRTGRYDRSVIVLTTDHGDSLGEGGNWGHGVSIDPEVVRIPLIVHIPENMKPSVTTDLTRVAFSTDIVPTLYSLLNHSVRDLGPLFGSPLFVPQGAELTARRRESFLLTSSYGPTYGVLRHNGRSLYIADLVNGRESAYDLTKQPIGARTEVTDDDRRVSQRWIRQRLGELADVYQFHPEP
jgi:hypothetical protein